MYDYIWYIPTNHSCWNTPCDDLCVVAKIFESTNAPECVPETAFYWCLKSYTRFWLTFIGIILAITLFHGMTRKFAKIKPSVWILGINVSSGLAWFLLIHGFGCMDRYNSSTNTMPYLETGLGIGVVCGCAVLIIAVKIIGGKKLKGMKDADTIRLMALTPKNLNFFQSRVSYFRSLAPKVVLKGVLTDPATRDPCCDSVRKNMERELEERAVSEVTVESWEDSTQVSEIPASGTFLVKMTKSFEISPNLKDYIEQERTKLTTTAIEIHPMAYVEVSEEIPGFQEYFAVTSNDDSCSCQKITSLPGFGNILFWFINMSALGTVYEFFWSLSIDVVTIEIRKKAGCSSEFHNCGNIDQKMIPQFPVVYAYGQQAALNMPLTQTQAPIYPETGTFAPYL